MNWHIFQTDCRTWTPADPDWRAHALVCDPPYALTGGFMGQKWDDEVAFQPATSSALARWLLPGAFGFCFASSRGWNRLACAIEDAGLILHPAIFCWVRGAGYPKASSVARQLDKTAGKLAERKVVGKDQPPGMTKPWNLKHATDERLVDYFASSRNNLDVTEAATPEGKVWQNHRYGRQLLKPVAEPIICFQVPYAGAPIESITQTGAGAINIEAGRITVDQPQAGSAKGRYPGNFALVHDPACTPEQCAAQCPVAKLDAQTGQLQSGKGQYVRKTGDTAFFGELGDGRTNAPDGLTDSGGASRFYHRADWWAEMAERIERADVVRYCGTAKRGERDAGIQARSGRDRITPMAGRGQPGLKCQKCGKWKISGSPCQCAEPDFVPVEFERVPSLNPHPAVKPLALCRWLANLLAPPKEYAPRRILVPFSGSGSEMIGALLSGGFDEIVGLEQDAGYIQIARQRLAWWQRHPHRLRPKASRRKLATEPTLL